MGMKIIAVSYMEYDSIRFHKIFCFEPEKVASELRHRNKENTNLQYSSGIGLSINFILPTKIISENLWFALCLMNNINHTFRNVCFFNLLEDTKLNCLIYTVGPRCTGLHLTKGEQTT